MATSPTLITAAARMPNDARLCALVCRIAHRAELVIGAVFFSVVVVRRALCTDSKAPRHADVLLALTVRRRCSAPPLPNRVQQPALAIDRDVARQCRPYAGPPRKLAADGHLCLRVPLACSRSQGRGADALEGSPSRPVSSRSSSHVTLLLTPSPPPRTPQSPRGTHFRDVARVASSHACGGALHVLRSRQADAWLRRSFVSRTPPREVRGGGELCGSTIESRSDGSR